MQATSGAGQSSQRSMVSRTVGGRGGAATRRPHAAGTAGVVNRGGETPHRNGEGAGSANNGHLGWGQGGPQQETKGRLHRYGCGPDRECLRHRAWMAEGVRAGRVDVREGEAHDVRQGEARPGYSGCRGASRAGSANHDRDILQ